MILASLLLLAVGTADLLRPRGRPINVWRTLFVVSASVGVLAIGVWGTGVTPIWLVAGVQIVVAWLVVTSGVDQASRLHTWPIAALAIAVGAALAFDPIVGDAQGWLVDWYQSLDFRVLAGVSFERFFLGLASVFFLTETANVIVRMILTSSGNKVLETEKTLQGGRLLGPIERLFIFAMALAGQFLAIGAVVAAKGILRYPEISSKDNENKAEYVLVGSFVSWAIALLTVPLLL